MKEKQTDFPIPCNHSHKSAITEEDQTLGVCWMGTKRTKEYFWEYKNTSKICIVNHLLFLKQTELIWTCYISTTDTKVILNFLLTSVELDSKKKNGVMYPVFPAHPMISGRKLHWCFDQLKASRSIVLLLTYHLSVTVRIAAWEMFNQ